MKNANLNYNESTTCNFSSNFNGANTRLMMGVGDGYVTEIYAESPNPNDAKNLFEYMLNKASEETAKRRK